MHTSTKVRLDISFDMLKNFCFRGITFARRQTLLDVKKTAAFRKIFTSGAAAAVVLEDESTCNTFNSQNESNFNFNKSYL